MMAFIIECALKVVSCHKHKHVCMMSYDSYDSPLVSMLQQKPSRSFLPLL